MWCVLVGKFLALNAYQINSKFKIILLCISEIFDTSFVVNLQRLFCSKKIVVNVGIKAFWYKWYYKTARQQNIGLINRPTNQYYFAF